jgi:ABC-type lipoprotein export system ATPase subunit
MNIEITRIDRALTPSLWLDVPDFVVICGANGCGKSQFLSGLAESWRALPTQGMHNRTPLKRLIEVSGIDHSPPSILHLTADWPVDQPGERPASAFVGKRTNLLEIYKKSPEGSTPTHLAFRRVEQKHGFGVGKMNEAQFMEFVTGEEFPTAAFGTLDYVSEAFGLSRSHAIRERLKQREPDLSWAPWVILNRLLESAGLPYCVNEPDTLDHEAPFAITLSHVQLNVQVLPAAMSSGERVMLKLFLLLFSTQRSTALPNLLLLDEPDAHLHPQMVQRFIKTIHSVLVKEHGMRIIMTTHSPTTVAICPEEALYEMKPVGESKRFVKVSRDTAIGLLSVGVPTLRVAAEHRRQSFVENDSDVQLFTQLTTHLSSFLIPEISLSFIASGNPIAGESSGCSRVRRWVKALRTAGSTSIFGIIDWDGDAQPDTGVHVLAQGQRHSIENCILDPLVLGAFLVKQQIIPSEKLKEIGVSGFLKLAEADDHTWKALADYVTEQVKAQLRALPTSTGKKYSSPQHGPQVLIDQWYFTIQGHDLQDAVEKAFPGLGKATKRNVHSASEDDNDRKKLLLAIVSSIGPELPGLFPSEIVEVFRAIQEAPIGST